MQQTTQQYSSADTSLNQIPALHRWYFTKRAYAGAGKPNVVDLGAGKYDAAGNHIRLLDLGYFPFDPYNRSEAENTRAMVALSEMECDVLCANVLNVIAEREHRAGVIRTAARCTGTAYFTVYEGDRTGTGRVTSKGYQNNRRTADYITELAEHFDTVVRKGDVLVCSN